PMHWLGLISHLAHPVGQATTAALVSALQLCITFATVLTIAAQTIFVLNVSVTLLRTVGVRDTNPWRAASLEWVARVPRNGLIVHRAAYEFSPAEVCSGPYGDFPPQTAPPRDTLPPPALNPG